MPSKRKQKRANTMSPERPLAATEATGPEATSASESSQPSARPVEDDQTMPPLLLCSIGNPGPSYANTLHSAGHILLNALIPHLDASSPVRSASYGKGLVSHHPPHVFWQSTAYMNDSGRGVAAAWRAFKATVPADGPQPRLVILHDELEARIGTYKVKPDTVGQSARGHNGLTSVLGMPGMGKEKITRVGIGIGPRPESREPEAVARFVLRKMSAQEREKIEGCAEGIWRKLGG